MNTRHVHADTSGPRPIPSIEQERLMMLGWVRAIRAQTYEFAPTQERLSKLEFTLSQPPFPVANPLKTAKEAANLDTAAIIFFAIGAALLVTAGTLVSNAPILAATSGVLGLVAQCMAFALAQPE